MSLTHIFAGNPLDRADAQRRDAVWLEDVYRAAETRVLPLWQLNVLLDTTGEPRLGWLRHTDIARLDIDLPPVFLGLREGIAHFAIDISEIADPAHELNLDDAQCFEDARSAAMRLPLEETGIVAQSRSQIDWHRRHGFCSVCGARTAAERGGHVRKCPDCGAEHFPRTDPVVIMLVVDGDQCLLGQSQGRLARSGMYSALAGFVDQGESIEEAVRREVREEAGIEVDLVRYHSSQPWPFPSSLMIGCHARAVTSEISMDTTEMADVRWIRREVIVAALRGDHPTLRVPGELAIAHHLIKAWALGDVDVEPRP